MFHFRASLAAELAEIESAGLTKHERALTTPQAAQVSTTSGEALNFCANNYLGLADDPSVMAAAQSALDEWGFGQPQVATVTVNVGYATGVFERRPGDFFDSMGALVQGAPTTTRYAAILADEGNRWIITLAGTVGDYPPTDLTGWRQFAASLPVPAVHELVSKVRPLKEITSYRFPADQRRLYERMKRFPDGYLVIGDAVCSFNPVYGQGMSVAALEAQALDDELTQGIQGLAARFYRRARKIVDIPWAIAAGEDLRIPQVEGKRPLGFAISGRYLERLHVVAAEDRVVCRAFMEVLNLLASPTSLLSPPIAWRVLRPRNSIRKEQQDPMEARSLVA